MYVKREQLESLCKKEWGDDLSDEEVDEIVDRWIECARRYDTASEFAADFNVEVETAWAVAKHCRITHWTLY